jgi:uncharacterized membrane protein/Mg-chelatase subunit ChlD
MTLDHPLILLLAVPAMILAVAIWRTGAGSLGRRRAVTALIVRLVVLAALLLGLAGLSFRLPESREATVFAADVSASNAASKGTMTSLINKSVGERGSGNVAGVVSFGRGALVEQPVAPLHGFQGFRASVDSNYTNMEDGLDLAGSLLPNGYRSRVVLLSDGRQNMGDALNAARRLHSQGVRVDVVPFLRAAGPEVMVDSVQAPPVARPGERFSLHVAIRSNVNTTAKVQIYRDRGLVLRRRETLHSGENSFTYQQGPLSPQFHTFDVRVLPARDSDRQNNSGSSFTLVGGVSRVLVIASIRREASNVVASLLAGGMQVDLMAPWTVTPTSRFLNRYAAIVIVDSPAADLGPELMRQLVPYVRDQGHGLVVIGGEAAYGLGQYAQTPMEQMLPVSMNLPKRSDIPTVAVVLMIEDLESDRSVLISKEAGKAVVNLLSSSDQVAVNDTPDYQTNGWAVTLRSVRNKAAINRAIDNMVPGDPLYYMYYFAQAEAALKKSKARIKHIIFIGDGDADDVNQSSVIKRIRSEGITVSTVATDDAFGLGNPAALRHIAVWGGGRYYRAHDPSKVPKIFLRETHAISRPGSIQARFYPRQVAPNPMTRDLTSVPPLGGYVVTEAKPTAEVVLESNLHDPVLADWQFGLGRTVAWTSDAAGRWTSDWLRSPAASRFWVNLVSWTLPPSASGHLFLTATNGSTRGTITADVSANLGSHAQVTARVVDPLHHVSTVQMQSTSPARFTASFPTDAQGSYLVTVEARGKSRTELGETGLAVAYSAEHRSIGADMPFLQAVASAGGGSIVERPKQMWADNLTAVYDQRSLSNYLWLVALFLLPVDIAVRRLFFGR